MSDDKRLYALMNALAEHTSSASDEDMLKDVEGSDTKAEAERVRSILRRGLKRSDSPKIIRNLSTEDGRVFWASAERIAEQASGWPASKLAGLNPKDREP